jgi:4,5-dihydroxyphthalate decarboxylase
MTQQPRLKIAIATYGHTKDIKSGAVAIAGVEPDFVEVVPIIGAFRRMVRDLEFDVCEMAPTTYMIARALGAPFIALPVFLMRRFHHGGFVVRPNSGIKEPKDLEGKKVGVRAYSVTTGVWTRGIFVNEYGLDSSKVTWVVDDEEHVTTLKLPANVVYAPDGKSLASMMASGELQAGFSGPAGIGRSGIYPIHGLIVVKTAVLAQHPFVAKALFDAFLNAKDAYVARLKAGEGNAPDDVKYRNLTSLVGDPLPYGLEENMPSIEAMLTYGLQQGLIPKRMPMEDVFVDPQRH